MKTASINIMVEPEIKKKLKEKADAMNLSITQLIEKVGKEDIAFLDDNFRKIARYFKLSM